MNNTYLPNFSYLFVPFATETPEDFSKFHKRIKNNGWNLIEIENRYLHGYVVDKAELTGNIHGVRFKIDREFAEKNGVHVNTKLYGLKNKKYKNEVDVRFDFKICDIELFAFNTSVCILAFKLCFKDNDPFKIAAAQYYLRKISTEKIYCDDSQGESFVDISARILKDASQSIPLDFFFYAARNNSKANFLTYIDVPKQADYNKELFYLKWCYSDSFEYLDEPEEADSEIYRASQSITWGISASAAVCLAQKSQEQTDFIENVFQKNFQNQYLLTYILLLHQKYMMYLFLTKMSSGLEGNLMQLERYKALLYDFETHYMFSYISEVPQYQRFYTKVNKMFSLEVLFQDVQEPLLQLTEIKKQKAEETQRESDHRINTALTALSVLTVVSALTDASGITANLNWIISDKCAKVIQVVALAFVVAICIYSIIRLAFPKKRK